MNVREVSGEYYNRRAGVIKLVIRLSNDAVMVFNAEGEQIPRYQGQYRAVRRSILKDAQPGTVFTHWFSQAIEPLTVSQWDW